MARKIIALTVLPFVLGGCVSLVLTKKDVLENPAGINKSYMPEFFNVPRTPAPIKCTKNKDMGSYRICEFAFKSWYDSGLERNDSLKGTIYLPKNPEKGHAFFVLPGAGENFSSRNIAKILASNGFYTVRIRSGFKPLTNRIIRDAVKKPDAESAVQMLGTFFKHSARQRIVDLMRIADFMEINYGVKKIHTVGVSLGGGIGSLFSAIDPRGESLMMMISSANISRILLDAASWENPPNQQLQEINNLLYGRFGLTYQRAYDLIERELRSVEPLTYKNRLDRSKIVMVSGFFEMFSGVDSIIPYSATKETWEAYGKPEWIILGTGHITSAFAMLPLWIELPYLHHSIYTIFQSYLSHLVNDHFVPLALR